MEYKIVLKRNNKSFKVGKVNALLLLIIKADVVCRVSKAREATLASRDCRAFKDCKVQSDHRANKAKRVTKGIRVEKEIREYRV